MVSFQPKGSAVGVGLHKEWNGFVGFIVSFLRTDPLLVYH